MNDLLVTAGWLAEHRDEVVVADVRWDPAGGTAGAERVFAQGHVSGAVFVDVDRDLAAEPFHGPGRHPLPTPEAFAATLGRLGIADGDLVIAYDVANGTHAARLWWMLDATGRRAALLDGGLAAWEGPLEAGAAGSRPPTEPEVRPWPSGSLADANDVATALRDRTAAVVDARAAERFRGETEPFDPVAGHIPGAINVPLSTNVDDEGRFRSVDELRAVYEPLGSFIAHCGSGLTACETVFAARLAGLAQPRLYEGSWSDWVHDGDRPVATGDA
jgi:thiosulfate/3-mercaptopyruvate sulfurtransferase